MAERITAVIPTYNRFNTVISRSLFSVLRQTRPVDEILLIGDGMEGIELARYEQLPRLDPRIKFHNIPRQQYPEHPGDKWSVLGLEARNFGLDQAQGDWIAPLDDDDEWTNDHVESLLLEAKNKGVDFAYGIAQYHWPDNHLQFAGAWPPGYGKLCDGSQLYRNGMGYRYDWGCLERGLPEDGDLWERMYAGGVTFSFLKKVVLHYYPNPR